jgi:hypothetical protein
MKPLILGVAATLLASGGLALTSGTAQAQAPHHWCPGEPMQYDPRVTDHTGPGTAFNWDMYICHTWYWVKGGQGNVPFKGRLSSSNVWDGETPPPNSDPGCGTDMFTGRPGTC